MLVVRRSSRFTFLSFQNHWLNFNQTLYKASLGEGNWYFMAVNIIMYDSVYRGSWVSIVLSLPGLKVHVNFSDWNLFFVRRSRRFHRCYREPFIFLSYSPKPLRLFQSNLSQNILWWNELKLIPTNDYASFQGGIILA